MGMLFVFIPRVSLRLPWAMCLLGLQPTLPKSETLVIFLPFFKWESKLFVSASLSQKYAGLS